MGIDMTVILNSRDVYRPGDSVEGHVQVINSGKKPCDIQDLQLIVLGQEYVFWSHTYCSPCCCFFGVGCIYRCTKTKTYENGVNFMDFSIPLLGESTIPLGKHEFPFQFSLPVDALSSYNFHVKTKMAHIGYFLTSKLKSSGFLKSVDKERVNLEVIGNLDLSTLDVHSPAMIEKEHPKGTYGFKVEIPKQGFVAGERIPFKAHFFIKGKESYSPPTISLVKVEYLKFGPKTTKPIETIVTSKGPGGTFIDTTTNWEDVLELPNDLPLTNLSGSGFISLNYCLEVNAFGLKGGIIPIYIGSSIPPPEYQNQIPAVMTTEFVEYQEEARDDNSKCDATSTYDKINEEEVYSPGRLNRNFPNVSTENTTGGGGQANLGFNSQDEELELKGFQIHK